MSWLKLALNMDIVSRQRINILIHLAGIQSVNASSPEGSLINRVAKECEFSQKDLKALITSPDPIGSFGALSEAQKKAYMYNICELMTLVELNQQKKLMCQKLAYDLSYDLNRLNIILKEFRKQTELQLN